MRHKLLELGEQTMVTRRFRTFALITCIGMLIVLLAGALVTNTDSGRGCGDDWPLCNGKFVPAYTVESLIEYSHRAVTGIEGILVVGVFVSIYRKYKREANKALKEPMLYAAYTLLFTILQAIMGAAAVMWPQSDPVMAIHFGISLVAFATSMLLVMWCNRDKKGELSEPKYSPKILPLTIGVAIYTYVVVYLGAFIRHTESAGGCLGWPLCNGYVLPEIEGAQGVAFIHRIAAALLGLCILLLYFYIRKLTGPSPLTRSGLWVFILVIAQVFSGAWIIATLGDENWFLASSLVHNLIIVVLFTLVIDMAIRAWKFKADK